jgi:hypothetical protein
MLDDFRQQAEDTSFEDEKPVEIQEERTRGRIFSRFRQTEDFQEPQTRERKPPRVRQPRELSGETFLGMTPAQRFVLVFMIFLLLLLLGILGLLVTGKVVPIF